MCRRALPLAPAQITWGIQCALHPAAAVAQTSFDLTYSYLNSAGNARSGKLSIAYVALMPNTVLADIAPGE
jgi:hypothetical protein